MLRLPISLRDPVPHCLLLCGPSGRFFFRLLGDALNGFACIWSHVVGDRLSVSLGPGIVTCPAPVAVCHDDMFLGISGYPEHFANSENACAQCRYAKYEDNNLADTLKSSDERTNA